MSSSRRRRSPSLRVLDRKSARRPLARNDCRGAAEQQQAVSVAMATCCVCCVWRAWVCSAASAAAPAGEGCKQLRPHLNLVLHQCYQGRHNQHQPCAYGGQQGVAEALASSSRHQDKRVLAVESRLNGLKLTAPKRVKACRSPEEGSTEHWRPSGTTTLYTNGPFGMLDRCSQAVAEAPRGGSGGSPKLALRAACAWSVQSSSFLRPKTVEENCRPPAMTVISCAFLLSSETVDEQWRRFNSL